jgi:hypothetical protein
MAENFTLSLQETTKLDLSVFKNLKDKVLQVGFLDGKSADYPDGASVAEVAIKLEYGFIADGTALQKEADRKNLKINVPKTFKVPGRPFMQTNWNNNKDKYQNKMSKYLSTFDKTKMTPDNFFNLLGVEVQKDIRDSITNGNWSPNAWFVAAIKESNKPLIDTGHLRQSVTWRVADAETEA